MTKSINDVYNISLHYNCLIFVINTRGIQVIKKNEEKELSAIENLAVLYMIDRIFSSDLFGKK